MPNKAPIIIKTPVPPPIYAHHTLTYWQEESHSYCVEVTSDGDIDVSGGNLEDITDTQLYCVNCKEYLSMFEEYDNHGIREYYDVNYY